MNAVFAILLVQVLMGALDNFLHHEITERLPQRASARKELVLHAARETIYGVLLLGFAWVQWHGAWILLPAVLMLAEVAITCADFVEEDRTRRLPPFESVLHTMLAVNYGVLLGVLAAPFVAWWQQPAQLVFTSYGLASWFFTFAGVAVLAWGARNALAVRRLGREDPPVAAARRPSGSATLVTGATGFIGSTLVRQLLKEGRAVIVHSRDILQARETFGPAAWVVDRLDDIPNEARIGAVVHLAGASVLGAPWTRKRRELLIASRTQVMQEVLALMRRLDQPPAVLVAASAVGFYGVPDAMEAVDENAPAQPGRFQSDLCVAVEHEARRAEALGVRVVRLRFGIVLGKQGGAYPALALAARFGLGAQLGSGRQAAPWIHIHDAVGLVRFAIERSEVAGPVNAVAPEITSQAAFAKTMAASYGRGVFLRVPDWALRLGLGEMSEILRCGQWAVPTAAMSAGYRYRAPTLRQAMVKLAARV